MDQKDPLLEASLQDSKNDLYEAWQQLATYHAYALDCQRSIRALEADLDRIRSSALWKASAPFRKLRSRLRPAPAQQPAPAPQPIPQPQFFDDGKNLLFFDSKIPTPDQDAGSRSVFQYLNVLQELGYHITFWSSEFEENSYAQTLRESGVCVLNGAFYREHCFDWLREHLTQFQTVCINRPDIASRYLHLVRAHSDARILYLACDLHFLREERAASITKDEATQERAQKMRVKEYAALGNADVSIVYSHAECQIIADAFRLHNVVVAPLYCFDAKPVQRSAQTQDFLFVGGFAHQPNVDGIRWFLQEVWSQIDLPDAKLRIIGAQPPQGLRAFADERVLFEGQVSDDALHRAYADCRVCIVPLRFGAGIKGKLLEAIAADIPVVSTSIGLEGLPDVGCILTPSDTAADFAAQARALYMQPQTQGYAAYIRQHFSKQALVQALHQAGL